MSKQASVKRECVGHVCVDHGGVVVLDPMYAELSDEDTERTCDAEVGVTLDCGDDNMPEGIDHIGVYVSTGFGDGRYPIYADVMTVPGGGTRVARIVIDCLGLESDPESDDLREHMVDAVRGLREQTGGGIDVKLPYDESRAVDDDIRRRALDEPEAEGDA
jgi:hypothetical protein